MNRSMAKSAPSGSREIRWTENRTTDSRLFTQVLAGSLSSWAEFVGRLARDLDRRSATPVPTARTTILSLPRGMVRARKRPTRP